MEDLKKYYTMVESIIEGLGVDPVTSRGKEEGSWRLTRGSAKVWLDLWHLEKEGRAYFQAMSPVMEQPTTQKEALYEELLQINDQLFSCAFTIYNGWIWLKVIREVDNMDESEAKAQILRIGSYADQYDDYLINKYGGGNSSDGGSSR